MEKIEKPTPPSLERRESHYTATDHHILLPACISILISAGIYQASKSLSLNCYKGLLLAVTGAAATFTIYRAVLGKEQGGPPQKDMEITKPPSQLEIPHPTNRSEKERRAVFRDHFSQGIKKWVGENELEKENRESALEEIRDCFVKRKTTLYLHSLQLSSLPPEIGCLTHVTSISLDGNHLSSLPKEIVNLKNLTHISICNNRFSFLPEELRGLEKLKSIACEENKIQNIPNWISDLKYLESLTLSSNELSTLPNEISELGHLKTLNLSKNKFSIFPEQIGGLKNLVWLYFNDNQLQSVSSEINNLTHLIELRFTNNQLSHLPDSLTGLQKLSTLNLSHNRFSQFPEQVCKLSSLTELRFDHNQITNISIQIKNLTRLSHLSIHSNELVSLPDEIGELVELKDFTFYNNSKLESLPDSLGNVLGLSLLDRRGTLVSDDNATRILSSCQSKVKEINSKQVKVIYLNHIPTKGPGWNDETDGDFNKHIAYVNSRSDSDWKAWVETKKT